MSETILAWQQDRRRQGVPTISALVGPESLGFRQWARWNAAVSRPVIAGSDIGAVARIWFGEVAAGNRLAVRAGDWLRRTLAASGFGDPVPQRMTRYDLDRVWSRVPDRNSDAAAVAYAALAAAGSDAPVDSEALIQQRGVASLVAGLCGLIPADAWPALLVIVRGDAGEFREAVREWERVALRVPLLPIAVSVSTAVWMATTADTSRSLALAGEGFIELTGVTAPELKGKLIAAGVAEPLPHDEIGRLASEGLAPEVAEAFVAAVAESRRPAPAMPEADELHRSAAELFLFELLEAMSETRGLFELNRPMEFRHGPRAAEADLAAAGLKLVIEVDGGYYHLNAVQYRRDRRKDHAYQRHGYWVLRFLAEDIVEDSESILSTILEAVAQRRGPSTPR